MPTLREKLVLVCDAYAAARGIGRQRTSAIFLNRGATLDRVAAGDADINTTTYERVLQQASDNWPDGAEWPHDVPRPARSLTEAAE